MNPNEVIRFDGWTFHVATGELANDRVRTRLQAQPQHVLEELLARPGELVTREQLIARLWPKGVVEFDTALNSAVRRLRTALDDHAETPRYIETIPRRGYRFIGHVELLPVPTARAREAVAPTGWEPRRWAAVAAVLLLLATVAAARLSQEVPGRVEAHAQVVRVDARAQDRYVRAQHFLQRRLPGDVVRARENLEEALAIAPGYAHAWAGLASALWLDMAEGRLPPQEGLPRVRAAAERALELDPGLAEAHLRLAGYFWRKQAPARAQRHLQEALELDPDNALGLSMAAGRAASNGHLERAIELQARSVEADPLSLVNRGNLVAWLIMASRLDEARQEMHRLRELSPGAPGVMSLQAMILILDGQLEAALALSDAMPDEVDRLFSAAVAHHGLGQQAEADTALRALIERSRDRAAILRIAEAYAYRGEPDRAFAWLQSSPDLACGVAEVRHSPFLRALHADPRWTAWISSAGRHAAAPRDVDGVG